MTIRPERYRNAIVPHIYVDGASEGIAFYKRAFGAVELFRMAHPNGKVLHAEISIAGSVLMIGDPDNNCTASHGRLDAVPPGSTFCGRQRGLAAARGRGGRGRNPTTHRHVLWR